jgi:uncharacterized protein YkwD
MKKLFLVFSVTVSSFGFSQNPVKLIPNEPVQFVFHSMKTKDSLVAFQNQIIDSTTIHNEFLQLINQYRKFKGLPEFELDSELCLAANNQCQYMVKNKYVGHKQANGILTNLVDRFVEFDTDFNYYNQLYSENALSTDLFLCFARKRTVVQQVLDQWATSKSHDQNQLNPVFTKIGISIIKSPIDNQVYAVAVFSEL